ncbi:MAG: thymidine phosphorylase [Clostridia bacterium]|nr:thymidine phosphorylase [Clostridia bacterium]
MKMYDLIQKKKEGKALTAEEIAFFVDGYTDGSIPDYQASAFLMAVCFRGMTDEETAVLTEKMMHSGDVLDLSRFGDRSVDKHSTGGVGDKTTLIVAPIAAACGAVVAKMTGRGLGHTGGTMDKMESVSGMRTTLSPEEFYENAEKLGICVVGQNKALAPADGKMYALRDVTATVESIPLIAASIMSKKLAAGAKNIVLDVKCGKGAFMKTTEDAEALARAMVTIGTRLGRRVRAVITDMSTPLGTAIGNSLEVKEAVEVLRGGGDERLRAIALELSSHMLALSLGIPSDEGKSLAEKAIASGKAFSKMKEWFSAQGGDTGMLEDSSLLPEAKEQTLIFAEEDGYLCEMDALLVGTAAGALGAGRKTKEDQVDHGAGIFLLKQWGDKVKKGEAIARLYATDKEKLADGKRLFSSAVRYEKKKPAALPLIYKIIS